jgi:hypothetical protein
MTSQPKAAASARASAAGLADAHRRAHIGLEEHLLDGHAVGPELAQQRLQLVLQFGQALGQRIGGRRADDTERQRRGLVPDGAQHGVAAASEAGVDAEHHHPFGGACAGRGDVAG